MEFCTGMLCQQGLVPMPRSFPFQHFLAPLAAALPPEPSARTRSVPSACHAPARPGSCPCLAASTELRASQGTQPKPEPRHLRGPRLPPPGNRPPSSPSAELETLTAPLLEHVHPQQGQSSHSQCPHSWEHHQGYPRAKRAVPARQLNLGSCGQSCPTAAAAAATASPPPSKAISKRLSPSWWLRRCAPGTGQAQHVQSR